MRIRTQNLIVIIPLFLGMAVATGAMTYSTARQEMLWGLEEEATSLSIAISALERPNSFPAIAACGLDSLMWPSSELTIKISE